jgi:threonine dehydrogenase-like Zn-dependent dehydrogenase
VLVVGASGAVGTIAVQLAVAFGATVTGVCNGDHVNLVRSLGAEEVIDYTREDFADGSRRFDVIIDIGGRTPPNYWRSTTSWPPDKSPHGSARPTHSPSARAPSPRSRPATPADALPSPPDRDKQPREHAPTPTRGTAPDAP